jgi:hypothetical protein
MTHSANPFAVALALLATGTVACSPNAAQHHVKEVPAAGSTTAEESAGCGAKAGCGASAGCGAKTETQPMAAGAKEDAVEAPGANAAPADAEGSTSSAGSAMEPAGATVPPDINASTVVASTAPSETAPSQPAPSETAPNRQSAPPKKTAKRPLKKTGGAQAGCGEGSCA